MKKAKDSEPLFTDYDLKCLKKLEGKIHIASIRVLKHQYQRDPILDEQPGIQMRIAMNMNNTGHINPDQKVLDSHVTLDVVGQPIDEKFKDKKAFSIETTVHIHYQAPEATSSISEMQGALNALCHSSSPLHAWAFLRQQVQEAMSNMLLPPFALPIMYPHSLFPMKRIPVEESRSTPAMKVKPRKRR